MMQKNQQLRTQLLLMIMAGVGFATAATAAGMDAGSKAGVGADAKVVAPDTAQAGGVADAYMSPSGSDNADAQWQSGATRGVDRAAERMSPNGMEPGSDLDATGKATAKSKRSGTR